MKRLALLVGMVMSLTGCTTIIGEAVNAKVAFQGGGEKSFTFLKKAGDTAILKSDIEQSFVQAFDTASLYRLAEYYDSDDGKGQFYIGVEAHKAPDGIEVAHHDDYGITIRDIQKATYTLDISETPTTYLVKMTCPSEYEDLSTLRGGLVQSEPFLTAEQVVKNFVHICSEAEPLIEKLEYMKGEFNLRLASDKVLAKFSRHLSEETACSDEQVKAFGIPNAKFFKLSSDGLETTLALAAFSSQRGTKVIYSFEYPYTLDSSGATTYDAAVVKAARQRINAIAND